MGSNPTLSYLLVRMWYHPYRYNSSSPFLYHSHTSFIRSHTWYLFSQTHTLTYYILYSSLISYTHSYAQITHTLLYTTYPLTYLILHTFSHTLLHTFLHTTVILIIIHTLTFSSYVHSYIHSYTKALTLLIHIRHTHTSCTHFFSQLYCEVPLVPVYNSKCCCYVD